MTLKVMEPSYILTLSYSDKDWLARRFDQWYKFILHNAVQYHSYYAALVDTITFESMEERLHV